MVARIDPLVTCCFDVNPEKRGMRSPYYFLPTFSGAESQVFQTVSAQ